MASRLLGQTNQAQIHDFGDLTEESIALHAAGWSCQTKCSFHHEVRDEIKVSKNTRCCSVVRGKRQVDLHESGPDPGVGQGCWIYLSKQAQDEQISLRGMPGCDEKSQRPVEKHFHFFFSICFTFIGMISTPRHDKQFLMPGLTSHPAKGPLASLKHLLLLSPVSVLEMNSALSKILQANLPNRIL